jgi:hypothetical protein
MDAGQQKQWVVGLDTQGFIVAVRHSCGGYAKFQCKTGLPAYWLCLGCGAEATHVEMYRHLDRKKGDNEPTR